MKIETILYPGINLMKKSQIVMENHINKLRVVKALNRGIHYIDLQITGNSKLTPPKFCETEKLTIIFQRFKYVTVKAYVKSVKKKHEQRMKGKNSMKLNREGHCRDPVTRP